MSYFIVTSGEDGVSVDGPLEEEEVLRRITADDEGNTYYGVIRKFLPKVPQPTCDIGEEEMVIIKGDVVVPKSVQTVTRYKIP